MVLVKIEILVWLPNAINSTWTLSEETLNIEPKLNIIKLKKYMNIPSYNSNMNRIYTLLVS